MQEQYIKCRYCKETIEIRPKVDSCCPCTRTVAKRCKHTWNDLPEIRAILAEDIGDWNKIRKEARKETDHWLWEVIG